MRLRADQQLFLSYLVLIALLTLAMSLGADSLLRRHLTRTMEADLRRQIELAGAVYDASLGEHPDSLAARLSMLSGRRVTIVTTEGEVIGESDRTLAPLTPPSDYSTRPEIRAALEGEIGRVVRHSQTLLADHLYLAVQTDRGEVLRLALPLAEVDAALAPVQRGIAGVGAIAVLLAALFSFGFSIAITRPLRRMGDAARAIAAGDLSRRVRIRRSDELGDLANALDTLADELQRRLGQLEGERAEMQALIDAMTEGVLAFSPDGSLRRANPAARRIFSLAGELEKIRPEEVSRRMDFLRIVHTALQGETVGPQELTGEGRTLLATAHPLPDGGAVLVLLDISELRRLEGVRRDFVANASHELKTPLTAIRGYSETLLDPDLPPDLARQFAGTVRNNAERLQRIVDDLLDLSRIEAGGWRIEPEAVDLTRSARDVWAELVPNSPEKQVELDLAIDSGYTRVRADPSAVRQILSNLFGNALRYTPEGGRVTLRARGANPDEEPRSDIRGAAQGPVAVHGWTVIEVADTGAGIPSPHLSRVFERFYRADPARSREEGGTGLGLAIVKHLIESHGGWVAAESQVGRGTIIRFTLPTDPAPAPAGEEINSASKRTPGENL